jgi:hypothetical protein
MKPVTHMHARMVTVSRVLTPVGLKRPAFVLDALAWLDLAWWWLDDGAGVTDEVDSEADTPFVAGLGACDGEDGVGRLWGSDGIIYFASS